MQAIVVLAGGKFLMKRRTPSGAATTYEMRSALAADDEGVRNPCAESPVR